MINQVGFYANSKRRNTETNYLNGMGPGQEISYIFLRVDILLSTETEKASKRRTVFTNLRFIQRWVEVRKEEEVAGVGDKEGTLLRLHTLRLPRSLIWRWHREKEEVDWLWIRKHHSHNNPNHESAKHDHEFHHGTNALRSKCDPGLPDVGRAHRCDDLCKGNHSIINVKSWSQK